MKMSAIHWPMDYVPGFTENFCSNEVIISGQCALNVCPILCHVLGLSGSE
jgi:hypothetical protein